MDKKKLVDILSSKTFNPSIDEDGDICFHYNEFTLVIMFDPNDNNYLRLVFPNFWPIENDKEMELAINVSIKVTRSIKAVKVFPLKDQMWVSIEFFTNSEDYVSLFIDKWVKLLIAAADRFGDEMIKISKSIDTVAAV